MTEYLLNILWEPTEAPIIESFTATNNLLEVGQEVTFNWKVENPSGEPFTCTLDFGDGSTSLTFNSCDSSIELPYIYLEAGDYEISLEVKDIFSNIETRSLTRQVVDKTLSTDGFLTFNPEDDTFYDPNIQAAWNTATNVPDLNLYGFVFDTNSAIVHGKNGNYTFIVPEVSRKSKTGPTLNCTCDCKFRTSHLIFPLFS